MPSTTEEGAPQTRPEPNHAPGDIVRARRLAILQTAQHHGASNVRLFGSVAANQARHGSDIDLLVDFEPKRSLLDQIALTQDLEDLLGVPVDVLTAEALHPLLRARILAAARPL